MNIGGDPDKIRADIAAKELALKEERERKRRERDDYLAAHKGHAADDDKEKSKMEFVGLAELHKKIQQSLTGGSMEALTKGIKENTGATKEVAKEILAEAKEIKGKLFADPAGAVFAR